MGRIIFGLTQNRKVIYQSTYGLTNHLFSSFTGGSNIFKKIYNNDININNEIFVSSKKRLFEYGFVKRNFSKDLQIEYFMERVTTRQSSALLHHISVVTGRGFFFHEQTINTRYDNLKIFKSVLDKYNLNVGFPIYKYNQRHNKNIPQFFRFFNKGFILPALRIVDKNKHYTNKIPEFFGIFNKGFVFPAYLIIQKNNNFYNNRIDN